LYGIYIVAYPKGFKLAEACREKLDPSTPSLDKALVTDVVWTKSLHHLACRFFNI
jgi:hypothetical protein